VLEHCLPEMGRCVGGEGADYSLYLSFPHSPSHKGNVFLNIVSLRQLLLSADQTVLVIGQFTTGDHSKSVFRLCQMPVGIL